MEGPFSIDVRAHDLTPVVEAKGQGSGRGSRGGVRVIDRGKNTIVQQKAVNCPFGIGVRAHDPAAVVDSEDRGFAHGIGVIDRGEDTLVQQKTVAHERGRVAVVAGAAHQHLHHAGWRHGPRLGCCRSRGRVASFLPPCRPRTGHRERCEQGSHDRRHPVTTDAGAVSQSHPDLLSTLHGLAFRRSS